LLTAKVQLYLFYVNLCYRDKNLFPWKFSQSIANFHQRLFLLKIELMFLFSKFSKMVVLQEYLQTGSNFRISLQNLNRNFIFSKNFNCGPKSQQSIPVQTNQRKNDSKLCRNKIFVVAIQDTVLSKYFNYFITYCLAPFSSTVLKPAEAVIFLISSYKLLTYL